MVPTWMNTEFDDKKRCECIFLILGHLPNLVNFIFDRNYPKLSMRSEQIRNEITSFSTGEQILIRVNA